MAKERKAKRISEWHGRPSKYDASIHCDLIVKVFEDLEGIAAFCHEADISIQTFYDWQESHPEFKDAYQKAMQIGRRKWEQKILGDPNAVNPTIWLSILKSRYGDNTRIKKIKDQSALARVHDVWQSLQDGEMSARDAKVISDIALTQVQVEDRMPIAEATRVPRDELLRQIETVKAVMDAQREERV